MDADIAFKTKEHTSCQNEQSCSCGSKHKQCKIPQKWERILFLQILKRLISYILNSFIVLYVT